MFSVLYYDLDPAWRERAQRTSADLPGTRVIVAATYGEAARHLREEPVDAVVADPCDDDVLPLLSLVREARGPIPFVLFMAPGREKTALAAFNSGATQYVEKGDDGSVLSALVDAVRPALPRTDTIDLERRAQHLEFLSRTALDFVGMDEEDDIYAFIGERVRDLVPGSLVRVTSFDPGSRLLTLRAFVGPQEVHRIFEEELGRSLLGWELPIDASPSAEPALRSQSLIEGPPTTYQLLMCTAPEEVCDRIDARLGPGRTFILGFQCRRGVYGTVVIRLLSGGTFANRDVVEAFVGQASVALLRRQARRRLAESEARYRVVVESQHELVCRFRPDGTHLVANEAYCRFFGLDPSTIVGSRFVPASPENERGLVDAYFRTLTRDHPDGTLEHRVFDRHGSARWLQWSDRGFFDGDGAPVEYQSVGRDVTERREAEEALAALTAELELRVEERTSELQTANRELESFTSSVSHDLRAPLRAIDGYLGILMLQYGAELPDDAIALVGRARSGVSSAARFIEGLLSFSRLSRQPLVLERVETGELVRAVIAELLAGSDSRRVEIELGPLPPCRADPEMLRHVYQNLLSNALKFTRSRDPARIAVSASTDGGETVYTIGDNGVGFPSEYAARLFDDFARFHDAREYDGSGIGLPLVRRIVERHGGRCWAEGEVDRGASLHFTLGPGGTADPVVES
ncbi:MAG: ATP-binding protein [Methanospirillum sp.]